LDLKKQTARTQAVYKLMPNVTRKYTLPLTPEIQKMVATAVVQQ